MLYLYIFYMMSLLLIGLDATPSIHFYSYNTVTKENNLTYHIVNATQTFLLVLQYFNWKLLVTSAIYYYSLCQ